MHLSIIQTHSLSSGGNIQNRRSVIAQGGMATAASTILTFPAASKSADAFASDTSSSMDDSDDDNDDDDGQRSFRNVVSLLDAKTISWKEQNSTPSWNKSRYRLSTLSEEGNNKINGNVNGNNRAPRPSNPIFYPDWMLGYWKVNYKFMGASFPQGRKILSLRTAGAGLGTCLSLPNVGYNPSPHAVRFLKSAESTNGNVNTVYEDLAYNTPRRFEAFLPQSKVLSVQTNGYDHANNYDQRFNVVVDDDDSTSTRTNLSPIGAMMMMSPKCFVTGDGCSVDENKNLHLPASRFAMDFDGPTRKSGRMTQSCDVTLLDSFCGQMDNAKASTSNRDESSSFASSKSFSQLLINQELQTFYREIMKLEQIQQQQRLSPNGDVLLGKVRVAAFLPKYIRALDVETSTNSNADPGVDYDENSAVAIYDYKILMQKIDEIEAAIL